MKKYLIALLLAVSTFMLAGCGQEQAVPEEKSIAVSVQAAKGGDIGNANIFSGTTKIKNETSVTVEAPGTIEEMDVEIGDKVSKGQTLLKLKGTDVENGVKQAQAALNSAQAAYNDGNIATENSQNQLESALNNAQVTYDKALSGYEETKRQFDNTEQLYQAGAISENDYKQAQANLEQTQKSVEQAQAGLDTAQKSYDIGVGNRQSAKAAIDSAKVGLENALSSRDKLTLKSPVDGIITAKNFEVNEMANQSQPAFVISSQDVLGIDLNITQADIDKFTEGQTVNVTISGQTVEGTVNYVPAVADSSSSLYKVEVLVDNADGKFKSGMSADVEVEVEKQSDVITVPKKAVFEEDGEKYVYIVDSDNRAVQTKVETGIETESRIEITSGINENDTVVIAGLSLIGDGSKLFPVVKED